MSRAERAAAARRKRHLWRKNPSCCECGIRTDPDGLKRHRPRLVQRDGRERIACRDCRDRLKAE